MKSKDNLKYSWNDKILVALAFTLPLGNVAFVPLMCILFVVSFIQRKEVLSTKKLLIQTAPYLSYFLLATLGLIWSKDTESGLVQLVHLLPLVILPISITVGKFGIQERIRLLLMAFVEGALIYGIICLIRAIVNYFIQGDSTVFFYTNFTFFSHPSYISMYWCMAIAILYQLSYHPNKRLLVPTHLAIITIVFLSILVILSSSKTGIAALFVTHILALIYWIKKTKHFKTGLSIIALIGICSVGVLSTDNQVSTRFSSLFGESDMKSTSQRKLIWGHALDIIKSSPVIGVGTGDANNSLQIEYLKKGEMDIAFKKLNAHNQFLQTTLQLGILGLVSLLFMLIFPLLYHRTGPWQLLTWAFLIILCLNFFSESMLERQSGMVFLAFISSLLILIPNHKQASGEK